MQENILKTSNVTKIFLKYLDGKNYKRKEEVSLRYMDNKSCYFSGASISNFNKPKWRAKAEIVAYTPEGVYSSIVIIRDTEYTLKNILYKVDLPKTWKFTQLRSGSRKKISLPLIVRFNDGLEINTTTYDISIGGFSFLNNQELNTIQTRFSCTCQIQFPRENLINFPDGILQTDAKYVRQKRIKEGYNIDEEKLLCFKFVNLSPNDTVILKNFLIKVE